MELTKYAPLLFKIANKFPEKFREDLLQEGFLALYDCSLTYDEKLHTPFESYAYKRVYYSMVDFIKKERTGDTSLDNVISDVDGYDTTYAELLEDEADLEETISNRDYYQTNLNNSSEIERFIKQRHYEEGLTPAEIVELYSELTLIKDVRTIKKILKN
jgi:RNA polymerase sigma factor (sigma-70 family)